MEIFPDLAFISTKRGDEDARALYWIPRQYNGKNSSNWQERADVNSADIDLSNGQDTVPYVKAIFGFLIALMVYFCFLSYIWGIHSDASKREFDRNIIKKVRSVLDGVWLTEIYEMLNFFSPYPALPREFYPMVSLNVFVARIKIAMQMMEKRQQISAAIYAFPRDVAAIENENNQSLLLRIPQERSWKHTDTECVNSVVQ
mmetsp:Transcript_32243/g.69592  ORF Transcript_32243/g.69592 Transcript_32243/m.69592 type:complete len:201 (-) Transcript_32243:229-831(-)